MTVRVTSEAMAALQREAKAAYPHECCGILLGKGWAITHALAARNVHPLPGTHFEIDPRTLIDAHRGARAGGPELVGYYHSHPVGEPIPSPTDAAAAAGDGRIWAIVASDAVRFWLDAADGFAALPYILEDA